MEQGVLKGRIQSNYSKQDLGDFLAGIDNLEEDTAINNLLKQYEECTEKTIHMIPGNHSITGQFWMIYILLVNV